MASVDLAFGGLEGALDKPLGLILVPLLATLFEFLIAGGRLAKGGPGDVIYVGEAGKGDFLVDFFVLKDLDGDHLFITLVSSKSSDFSCLGHLWITKMDLDCFCLFVWNINI